LNKKRTDKIALTLGAFETKLSKTSLRKELSKNDY